MIFDIYEHPAFEASFEDTPAIVRVGANVVAQMRMFGAALAAAASWSLSLPKLNRIYHS